MRHIARCGSDHEVPDSRLSSIRRSKSHATAWGWSIPGGPGGDGLTCWSRPLRRWSACTTSTPVWIFQGQIARSRRPPRIASSAWI